MKKAEISGTTTTFRIIVENSRGVGDRNHSGGAGLYGGMAASEGADEVELAKGGGKKGKGKGKTFQRWPAGPHDRWEGKWKWIAARGKMGGLGGCLAWKL